MFDIKFMANLPRTICCMKNYLNVDSEEFYIISSKIIFDQICDEKGEITLVN